MNSPKKISFIKFSVGAAILVLSLLSILFSGVANTFVQLDIVQDMIVTSQNQENPGHVESFSERRISKREEPID